METYTMRSIQSMLGISRAVIGSLVAAGFVAPSRGPRNEYRFTFQDVVLLRTAYALQRARISPRTIVRSLKRLRETLPEEMPLSGLRISAVGSEIAVQEGDARRGVQSGQLLFDFDVKPPAAVAPVPFNKAAAATAAPRPAAASGSAAATGSSMRPAPAASPSRSPTGLALASKSPTAPVSPSKSSSARVSAESGHGGEADSLGGDSQEWFEHGSALESVSPADAEHAYRCAIALAPDYVDPYLNLGVLMCDGGRCAEAVALYEEALRRGNRDALLHFNLAVALEDSKRNDQALAHYEASLRLDPDLADAHYNAARLHELCGHRSQAIRHYSAYRRLQR